uniref:Uncharacterized protein n=1 Tax=Utricularia reniformis TaxID=192314 RepID=A0A1Y0AZV9_9LAMI|nr:hypothetical protein AEK19_MT0399 [Utricularia reniformis]ART30669.1 hypothetical protein AEK19_MT0399 [Utricularia reniformis]
MLLLDSLGLKQMGRVDILYKLDLHASLRYIPTSLLLDRVKRRRIRFQTYFIFPVSPYL